MKNNNITLAITGASGMPIAFKLLSELLRFGCNLHVVISKAAIITIKHELNLSLSANVGQTKDIIVTYLAIKVNEAIRLTIYGEQDWFAPIASGSSVSEVMVICPCSMATLGQITAGIGDSLITRAADVVIKERKNLILIPREMPFSAIHLKNMCELAKIGVAIMPPQMEFYTFPKTINDLIDFNVGRILDQIGIKNELTKRWSKAP